MAGVCLSTALHSLPVLPGELHSRRALRSALEVPLLLPLPLCLATPSSMASPPPPYPSGDSHTSRLPASSHPVAGSGIGCRKLIAAAHARDLPVRWKEPKGEPAARRERVQGEATGPCGFSDGVEVRQAPRPTLLRTSQPALCSGLPGGWVAPGCAVVAGPWAPVPAASRRGHWEAACGGCGVSPLTPGPSQSPATFGPDATSRLA